VVVPADQLICLEEGQGLKQANAVFGYTRLMVGAFGLGGGQAPLERALAYSKTRMQFGAPIFEKQGYQFKLLVENWIDLAAGRAYAEQSALTIDNGNHDLATEGSIAKYWCTESGLRAANCAIQALGGYGYTREYMVEKMYRDVRITTIYEGTSEIQQSIIGMYRWRQTVRSKGQFYEDLAVNMDALQAKHSDVGAQILAVAIRGLNEVVQHLHKARLTRNQIIMFTMADMMTICEVAAAFAEKAARLESEGDSQAAHFAAMSRVFARKSAGAVLDGARKCLVGFTSGDDEDALVAGRAVMTGLQEAMPLDLTAGMWLDMTAVGETLGDLD